MLMKVVFLILSACVLLQEYQSCYIWGTDSGYCETQSTDLLWRQVNMPFCAKAVQYPSCVPKAQFIPPTMEFPSGRWYNHTIKKKDQWVQDNALNWTRYRIIVETNSTLKHAGVNEYGDHGRVARRFFKHPDCANAYQNYFCWINFPRCDASKDLTLPTCRSACENYFISCGYATDLWRCGKSKWFNGYFPESNQTNLKGNTTYMRDYFPGQPFRQNKYTHLPTPHPTSQHGQELAICTPAITGSGSPTRSFLSTVATFCMVASLCSLFYFI